MGLLMIEYPVYKERYQYNVISKSFVSFNSTPQTEGETAEPPNFGSTRATFVLPTPVEC